MRRYAANAEVVEEKALAYWLEVTELPRPARVEVAIDNHLRLEKELSAIAAATHL